MVRIPFGADGLPSGPPEDFVRNSGSDAKWPSGMRPVDVLFDAAKGSMFFSSAATNEVPQPQNPKTETLNPKP